MFITRGRHVGVGLEDDDVESHSLGNGVQCR